MDDNEWVIRHYEPNPIAGVSYLRVSILETEYVLDWSNSEVIDTKRHVMYFKDDDDDTLPYHLKFSWTKKNDDSMSVFEVQRISTVWASPDMPFENAPFHKY